MSTTTETTITNQPAVCVAVPADPTCEQGWPCLACCDAMNVPEVHLVGISETARTYRNGSGSGHGSTVLPASEKQIAFLTRLVAQKTDPAVVTDRAAFVATLTAQGRKAVSSAIDRFLKLPDFVAPGAPAAFRWTKVNEEWFVRGESGVAEGSTITVTKANGDTAEARIVGVAGDGLYRVERVEAPLPAAATDLTPGAIGVTAEGEWIKVKASKSTGNLYGMTGRPGDWTYGGKAALRAIVRPLSAEEAAEYGHLHESCCFCGRHLSDDKTGRSMDVGYGPRCASKYGLPWG